MTTPPPPPQAPAWPTPPDPPELPAGVVAGHGRPAWAPITAILAIVAALAASLGGGLIIAIVGVAFGAEVESPPPSITIISTVFQEACFVAAAFLFARMRAPVAPWQLGLRGTRVWPAVGWTVLAFAALIGFSVAWSAIIGRDEPQNLPDGLGVDSSDWALVFSALLVTVAAPIGEEILFRGYVFPALRNWKGLWPAVVIAGALFGLLHVAGSPPEALLPLAVFGSLLCLLYYKTKSLYPPIALHAINNAIAFGGSQEVDWDWQILPLALGALAILALVALAVRRRFGPPPAGLVPV